MIKKIILYTNEKAFKFEDIKSYETCITYALYKGFKEIPGIEIEQYNAKEILDKNITGDVLLTAMNIYWMPEGFYEKITTENFKKIYIFGDTKFYKKAKNTVFFSTVKRNNPLINMYKIKWAGFPEYQYPEQKKDGYTYILLDHWDYVRDKEGKVIKQYWDALQKIKKKYKVKVDIITPRGIKKFNLNKFEKQKPVQFKGLKWTSIMKSLRRYHIFCVTHKESGGLSLIESAMCGSSIIIPPKCIERLIKKQVNHINTKNNFYKSLENAILNLNIEKNVEIAKKESWHNVCLKILKVMNKYQNRKIRYFSLKHKKP